MLPADRLVKPFIQGCRRRGTSAHPTTGPPRILYLGGPRRGASHADPGDQVQRLYPGCPSASAIRLVRAARSLPLALGCYPVQWIGSCASRATATGRAARSERSLAAVLFLAGVPGRQRLGEALNDRAVPI